MASGDDIEAGANTGANNTTRLFGERVDDDDPPDFAGDIILEVVPLRDADRRPGHTLHGILGHGWNGGGTSPGGTGVIGMGGPRAGIGVFGRGGGEDGSGGAGVHGQGGEANDMTGAEPGPGVIGQGGVQGSFGTPGGPSGPGVIGIPGGGAVPPLSETQDIGVFGSSLVVGVKGNGEGTGVGVQGVSDDGQGVWGQSKNAPGVFGRSDNQNGVAGFSLEAHGVDGVSDRSIGVRGHSSEDRGGVFESARVAQLRLLPKRADLRSDGTPDVPGRAGDLLVTLQDDREKGRIAILWFCEKDNTPWRRVSLV